MNGQTPVAQFREYVEQQVCTTVKGPIVPGAPISGLLPQPGDGMGQFYLPRPHTGTYLITVMEIWIHKSIIGERENGA